MNSDIRTIGEPTSYYNSLEVEYPEITKDMLKKMTDGLRNYIEEPSYKEKYLEALRKNTKQSTEEFINDIQIVTQPNYLEATYTSEAETRFFQTLFEAVEEGKSLENICLDNGEIPVSEKCNKAVEKVQDSTEGLFRNVVTARKEIIYIDEDEKESTQRLPDYIASRMDKHVFRKELENLQPKGTLPVVRSIKPAAAQKSTEDVFRQNITRMKKSTATKNLREDISRIEESTSKVLSGREIARLLRTEDTEYSAIMEDSLRKRIERLKKPSKKPMCKEKYLSAVHKNAKQPTEGLVKDIQIVNEPSYLEMNSTSEVETNVFQALFEAVEEGKSLENVCLENKELPISEKYNDVVEEKESNEAFLKHAKIENQLNRVFSEISNEAFRKELERLQAKRSLPTIKKFPKTVFDKEKFIEDFNKVKELARGKLLSYIEIARRLNPLYPQLTLHAIQGRIYTLKKSGKII